MSDCPASPLGARAMTSLSNEMECALPAGLVEDVDQDVCYEGDPFSHALLVDLIGWRLKRPIDEHGAADDVLARNEAPVAAVQALRAVVAHREYLAWGDDQVVSLNVIRQIVLPARGEAVVGVGWDRGEVGPVGVEGMLRVVVIDGLAGLGLIPGDAVQIHDAVAQVNPVAGDGDGALHEVEIRFAALEDVDNFYAPDSAVVGEGSPLRAGRHRNAMHQHLVADEHLL